MASIDKYIASFRHSDATVLWAEIHCFGCFADVSQTLGVDIDNSGIMPAIIPGRDTLQHRLPTGGRFADRFRWHRLCCVLLR